MTTSGRGPVTVRCPFCNNTVFRPEEIPRRRRPPVKINAGSGLKLLAVIIVTGIIVVGGIIVFSVYFAMKQGEQQKPTFVVNVPAPPKNFPGLPASPPKAPENAFAREVLKFGGEGTGPGYFSDARHVP